MQPLLNLDLIHAHQQTQFRCCDKCHLKPRRWWYFQQRYEEQGISQEVEPWRLKNSPNKVCTCDPGVCRQQGISIAGVTQRKEVKTNAKSLHLTRMQYFYTSVLCLCMCHIYCVIVCIYITCGSAVFWLYLMMFVVLPCIFFRAIFSSHAVYAEQKCSPSSENWEWHNKPHADAFQHKNTATKRLKRNVQMYILAVSLLQIGG